jgi:hypothetical protein
LAAAFWSQLTIAPAPLLASALQKDDARRSEQPLRKSSEPVENLGRCAVT